LVAARPYHAPAAAAITPGTPTAIAMISPVLRLEALIAGLDVGDSVVEDRVLEILDPEIDISIEVLTR
jgi:hypothetical protein